MAVYKLLATGAALGWPGPVQAVQVDCAAIKAGTQIVTTSADVVTTCSSGFVQNDYLITHYLPAGTLVTHAGAYCTTAEGAACLVDFGDFSAITTPTEVDEDGWLNDFNANSAAGSELTAVADGYGCDTVTGVLNVAARWLGCKFVSAGGADACKFTVFVIAFKAIPSL